MVKTNTTEWACQGIGKTVPLRLHHENTILSVLVACEYSGRVRDAFTRHGHFAMSCDLLPSETPGFHYQGDIFDILHLGWDLMICHPPCTHLAVSGGTSFSDQTSSRITTRSIGICSQVNGRGHS